MGTITSVVLTSLYYNFGGWRHARMLSGEPYGQAPDSGVAAPTMVPPKEDEDAAVAVAAAGG